MPTAAPYLAQESSLAIQIRDARLRLGPYLVFDGLSADFPAETATCLLGKSGVGKTTLLRAIAGLAACDPPDAITDGRGRPLNGRVAYMAQQDLLLPWLSVLDNVLLGSRYRGEPPPRNEAMELLEQVGLASWAPSRPAQLSGGMRQRAALVRTLIEQRPVVLLDEPFAALDAVTRVQLQELAAELLCGRTVILVTHDPLEALRLGNVVRILHGQPAQIDPAITPPGKPPRPFTDHEILELQGRLLKRLTETP